MAPNPSAPYPTAPALDGHRADKPDGHRTPDGQRPSDVRADVCPVCPSGLSVRCPSDVRPRVPEIDESVRHSHAFGLFLIFTTTTSFNFFTDWKNSWGW